MGCPINRDAGSSDPTVTYAATTTATADFRDSCGKRFCWNEDVPSRGGARRVHGRVGALDVTDAAAVASRRETVRESRTVLLRHTVQRACTGLTFSLPALAA